MQSSLLQQIATGDQHAMDACMSQFGGSVWQLARRMSATTQDAEDAVQEVFLSLWQNADRFDPGVASERTFVMMIARRRLIDRNRKEDRTIQSVALLVPEVVPEQDSADPVELADEVTRVRAAMRGLPADAQDVLRLALLDGKTQSEIAVKLGMPLGTVKSHARRGLAELRDRLSTKVVAEGDPKLRRAGLAGGKR